VATGVAWAGAVLDALRGVRWPAQRRVAAGVIGAHRSRRLGAGAEFIEYRLYRQGDDPRRIDWKLLARSDRAYVRLSEDQAMVPTTIVADASASMAYPVDSLAKWNLARALAIGLASVTHNAGDPVGVTVVDGERVVSDVRATTRRGIVPILAESLAAVSPGEGPGMAGHRPLASIATRGRIVIIGDFLDGADDVVARARAARQSGAEVYAVHVVAREELDPPAQPLLVSDPENVQLRRPLIAETRREYLEAFGAWRDAIRRQWVAAGAVYTIVSTDEPSDRAVRRIVRS
jgi:uncharacterized protein (DUF58 family)